MINICFCSLISKYKGRPSYQLSYLIWLLQPFSQDYNLASYNTLQCVLILSMNTSIPRKFMSMT